MLHVGVRRGLARGFAPLRCCQLRNSYLTHPSRLLTAAASDPPLRVEYAQEEDAYSVFEDYAGVDSHTQLDKARARYLEEVSTTKRVSSLVVAGKSKGNVCYGCGALIIAGIATGVQPALTEVSRHKAKNLRLKSMNKQRALCNRCKTLIKLSQVGDNENVAKTVKKMKYDYKAEVSSEIFMKEVKKIQSVHKIAMVLHVIDATDIDSTIIRGIREMVGGTPIIAAVTKSDLMPAEFGTARDLWYVRSRLKQKGINCLSVFCVDGLHGVGVDEMMRSVLSILNGRHLFVVGCANVGKSTLVNAIVQFCCKELYFKGRKAVKRKALVQQQQTTASALPGTTLMSVRIPCFQGFRQSLFDTPGLFNRDTSHIDIPPEVYTKQPGMLTPQILNLPKYSEPGTVYRVQCWIPGIPVLVEFDLIGESFEERLSGGLRERAVWYCRYGMEMNLMRCAVAEEEQKRVLQACRGKAEDNRAFGDVSDSELEDDEDDEDYEDDEVDDEDFEDYDDEVEDHFDSKADSIDQKRSSKTLPSWKESRLAKKKQREEAKQRIREKRKRRALRLKNPEAVETRTLGGLEIPILKEAILNPDQKGFCSGDIVVMDLGWLAVCSRNPVPVKVFGTKSSTRVTLRECMFHPMHAKHQQQYVEQKKLQIEEEVKKIQKYSRFDDVEDDPAWEEELEDEDSVYNPGFDAESLVSGYQDEEDDFDDEEHERPHFQKRRLTDRAQSASVSHTRYNGKDGESRRSNGQPKNFQRDQQSVPSRDSSFNRKVEAPRRGDWNEPGTNSRDWNDRDSSSRARSQRRDKDWNERGSDYKASRRPSARPQRRSEW